MFGFMKKTADKDPSGQPDPVAAVISAVREIAGESVENIKLDGSTLLEEIGFDSMRYLKLMLRLEKICGKSLSEIVDELDLSAIKSISQVADIVVKFRA